MPPVTLQPIRQRYGEYRFFEANRELSPRNIEAISNDIEETYLLDLYPIVTDKEKVVFDGQHRLTVAQALLLPFYAIETDSITIDDIARANENTIPYSVDDACYCYNKMGVASYEYLNDFRDANPHLATMKYAAHLLDEYTTRQAIIDGKFCVSRPEYASKVSGYLADFFAARKYTNYAPYAVAIENLAFNPGYNHELMKKRLLNAPLKLVRCNTRDEAMSLIQELYNYHAKGENRGKFKFVSPSERVNRYDKAQVAIDGILAAPQRGVAFRPVTINCSSDYSRFSLHPSRRPLNQKKLVKLTQAMGDKNLLHLYPIICDPSGVIIDGQRRFLAAVELGLPIHYIESSSASLFMIIRASTRAKAWILPDYLKHFCVMGLPDYLSLSDMLARHKRNDTYLLTVMLSGNQGDYAELSDTFKSGKFRITHANETLKTLNCLGRIPASIWDKGRMFALSLFNVIRDDPSFDVDHFVEKAARYPRVLDNYVDRETCRECILKTYNYYQRREMSSVAENYTERLLVAA